MTLAQTAAVLLPAFAAGWAGSAVLVPLLGRVGRLDIPNERSSHTVPVPRGGGVGVLLGFGAGVAAAAALGSTLPDWRVLAGVAVMAGLGLYEDLVGDLAVWWRLLVQVAAATLVIQWYGPLVRLPLPAPLDVDLGLLGWPLSLLWVVGVMNIFNFLDGIDGFAGAQGVIAGLGLAAVGWGSWLGPTGLAAAGACLGFLIVNWHPARIFMGDVGSLALGFLFAVMPLGGGVGRAPLLVFVAALCLWFFLADGVVTIVRRLMRGERIWQAHRSHLYQRLTIAGWSHARVVLHVGIGMVVVAGGAVGAAVCARPGALWVALGLAAALFVVYWTGVVAVERRAAVAHNSSFRGTHG